MSADAGPFIYTTDDVLRTLDALVAGTDGAWWNEFFAEPPRPPKESLDHTGGSVRRML